MLQPEKGGLAVGFYSACRACFHSPPWSLPSAAAHGHAFCPSAPLHLHPAAAKLPTVRKLRDAIYSPEFRAFISHVTGGCHGLGKEVNPGQAVGRGRRKEWEWALGDWEGRQEMRAGKR